MGAVFGGDVMDHDELRRRLEKIFVATERASGIEAPGWWVGDTAAERRAMDDLKSGRLAWRMALDASRMGLQKLSSGDSTAAEECLWLSHDCLMDALWTRIQPKDISFLSKGAERRGRPTTTAERNLMLHEAVTDQEALGLRGKAARAAALNARPHLAKMFSGMSDDTIAKALRNTRSALSHQKPDEN